MSTTITATYLLTDDILEAACCNQHLALISHVFSNSYYSSHFLQGEMHPYFYIYN